MTNFSDSANKELRQKVPMIPPASIKASRSISSFPAPRSNTEQGNPNRRTEQTKNLETNMKTTNTNSNSNSNSNNNSKVTQSSAFEPEIWSSAEDLFWVSLVVVDSASFKITIHNKTRWSLIICSDNRIHLIAKTMV